MRFSSILLSLNASIWLQMLLDLISEGERQKSAHAAAKFLDASLSRQAYSAAIKGESVSRLTLCRMTSIMVDLFRM